MTRNSNSLYIVIAREENGATDPNALYGDEQVVFGSEEEAEAAADDLASDECWGVDGDKTATEVGITYEVEEVSADDLTEHGRIGGLHRQSAINAGYVK